MCPRAVYDLGWSTFLSSLRQAVPPCSWLPTMLAALSSQSIQTAVYKQCTQPELMRQHSVPPQTDQFVFVI